MGPCPGLQTASCLRPSTIPIPPTRRLRRRYFDEVLNWRNVSAVHMPGQNVQPADILRLYGDCSDRVLAFSSTYASFELTPSTSHDPQLESNSPSPSLESWLENKVCPAIWLNLASVKRKAMMLVEHMKRQSGAFTCVHFSDLDNAVARVPVSTDAFADGAGAAAHRRPSIDISEPAARSLPFGSLRLEATDLDDLHAASACDSYEAEATSPVGRRWVRELTDAGVVCRVADMSIVDYNLPLLPKHRPIVVLADGERMLPSKVMERTETLTEASAMHMAELLRVTGVQLNAREWPGVEQEVCSQADTLMLNGFSPLSSIIRKRARMAAKARGVSPPVELYWQRPGFDVCMPLFTRTARFDIQPNRYGILGQFGPDRKLQLVATNVTAIVGMDRRLRPTAYVEMQIYCSNGSHHLSVFEYTKENNLFGLNFRIASPSEGWVPHKWHNIVVQVDDSFYSDPQSTPWENMDRLELYYSAPSPKRAQRKHARPHGIFCCIACDAHTPTRPSPLPLAFSQSGVATIFGYGTSFCGQRKLRR